MGSLFGESVPVEKLVEQGITQVPAAYIQKSPISFKSSSEIDASSIPIIDLSALDSDESRRRSSIIDEIRQACETWGFFHVVNHGVPEQVLEDMMQAQKDFFNLPMEAKMKYFTPEIRPFVTRYGVRLNDRSVVDWRDYLSMGTCHPLTDEVISDWPSDPQSFRPAAVSFCKATRKLGLKLMGLISESLDLPSRRIEEVLGELLQTTLLNRYLPCPEAHLVLALRNHSDPGALTMLVQNEVDGLQVRKDDAWVPVRPVPGSIVVNVGDHMQIMSNGRYKSSEHRAIANSERTRYSIATFMNPPSELKIGPLPELLAAGEKPRYASISFSDYIKTFIALGADAKASLQSAECKN